MTLKRYQPARKRKRPSKKNGPLKVILVAGIVGLAGAGAYFAQNGQVLMGLLTGAVDLPDTRFKENKAPLAAAKPVSQPLRAPSDAPKLSATSPQALASGSPASPAPNADEAAFALAKVSPKPSAFPEDGASAAPAETAAASAAPEAATTVAKVETAKVQPAKVEPAKPAKVSRPAPKEDPLSAAVPLKPAGAIPPEALRSGTKPAAPVKAATAPKPAAAVQPVPKASPKAQAATPVKTAAQPAKAPVKEAAKPSTGPSWTTPKPPVKTEPAKPVAAKPVPAKPAPAKAAPAKAAVAAAKPAPKAPAAGRQALYFDKNSSYLTGAERERVLRMAESLKSANGTVHVSGFADAGGDQKYNRWMAERRANRVAELIRAKTGGKVRVVVDGVGSGTAGDAQQRRVEVEVR